MQERLGVGRLVVGGDELLGLLEALLGPVGLGVAAGLDEVEVGRRDEQVGGAASSEIAARDDLVRLVAERQPVLRLRRCASCARCRGASTRGARRWPSTAPRRSARRARSPWPGRPLPRRSAAATLPISLRYIRTGSSMPIMSAAMRLELLGGRLLDLLRVELGRRVGRQLAAGSAAPSSATTMIPTSAPSSAAASGPRSRSSSSSSSSSSPATATPGLRRATDGGRPAWPLRGRPWRDGVATGRPPRVACRGDRRTWVTSGGWRAAGSGRGAGRATGALR